MDPRVSFLEPDPDLKLGEKKGFMEPDPDLGLRAKQRHGGYFEPDPDLRLPAKQRHGGYFEPDPDLRLPAKQRQKAWSQQLWQEDENMLLEVFKYLDARSLTVAACVNRKWRKIAEEESLWEAICIKYWHWPKKAVMVGRVQQVRAVVLALGGFRRLYLDRLRPLVSKPNGCALPLQPLPLPLSRGLANGWTKDEVHLSLSLYSIDCYERLGRCPPLKGLPEGASSHLARFAAGAGFQTGLKSSSFATKLNI